MCKSRYLICSLAKKLTSLKFTVVYPLVLISADSLQTKIGGPVLSFTISNWDLKYHKFVFSQNAESNYSKLKKKKQAI